MENYKRLTNNNIDEYNPEYVFCCYCKFFGGEPRCCNSPIGTCKNHNRFLGTYNRLAELEDKIENGTLVELPCKCIEELDIIKDGMIFIFYKMCLEQNLGQGVFLEYKSKINEWFKNYLKNKELQEKEK